MSIDQKAQLLTELVENSVTRRAFGQRVVMAAAGAAGLSAFTSSQVWAQSGLTDVDILNFALNLEYLEAEFYTVATTGRRIGDLGIGITGTGRTGATTGGAVVSMDDRVKTVSDQIADDEQKHVLFLRAALGSAAIAKPAINLEALGLGFRTQAEFLTVARAFEDTGVTAYGGAAPLIQSKEILASAARIALTEAQHAGVLRYFTFERNLTIPALDEIDVRPQSRPGDGRVFNVDGNGLSPVRTPSQVLAIVYAARAAGTRSGGFFPSGVNGPINSI